MERDIFISYSRKDIELVKQIKQGIERSIGVQCWMDLNGIESGNPHFTKEIIDGINNCKVFLFMLSKQSQESEFALKEIKHAYKKRKTHGINVVMINIDGCELTDEFDFDYGDADTILWSNEPQRDKLIRDLRIWTGSIDKAEAAIKAKEYLLNQKERKAFYEFSGSINDEYVGNQEVYLTYNYTQAEIDHFIQLFIDLYNEEAEDENDTAKTLDDIIENINLWEYEGSNPELDKLFQRCKDDGMPILNYFDRTPCYFYHFSYICWDPVEMEISNRRKFEVELTDEEYIYLLTEQLSDRRRFTFNHLTFENPQLAIKIANVVARIEASTNRVPHYNKWGYSYNEYNSNPLLIIFDEVLADVEAIQGPLSYSKQLYYTGFFVDDDNWYCAYVATEGRQMYLLEGEFPWGSRRVYLNDINADEVMKRLEAVDYPDMLNKLKERYNTSTALADIKSWLDAESIAYKEV